MSNGQLLLSARASRQRFYRDEAVTMPHHIEVALMPGQPSQIAFDVDVGSYAINRLTGDSTELWAMPQIEGYPSVDIADPQFRPPVAAIPPGSDGTNNPYLVPGGHVYGPSGYGAYEPPRTATLTNYPRLRQFGALTGATGSASIRTSTGKASGTLQLES